MTRDKELTAAFIEGYHIAGKEIGYWGRRFLQCRRKYGSRIAKAFSIYLSPCDHFFRQGQPTPFGVLSPLVVMAHY
jgi:hypothetical protein